MYHQEIARIVIDKIRTENLQNRVVSIDFETKVLNVDTDLLTGEILLGVGVSRRLDGKIDTRTFVLEEETNDSEFGMLKNLGNYFREVEPVALIGYGISSYDYPLIMIKLKRMEQFFKERNSKPPPEYWSLRNAFVQSYVLDSMNFTKLEIAKHEGKDWIPNVSLDKVIVHPRFNHLPFKRTKDLIINKMEKGKIIYDMWKNDKENFKRYLEGDVHDTLLITEDIFKINS